MSKPTGKKHTTHYACKEVMAKYGGQAECCYCTGHTCKPQEKACSNPLVDHWNRWQGLDLKLTPQENQQGYRIMGDDGVLYDTTLSDTSENQQKCHAGFSKERCSKACGELCGCPARENQQPSQKPQPQVQLDATKYLKVAVTDLQNLTKRGLNYVAYVTVKGKKVPVNQHLIEEAEERGYKKGYADTFAAYEGVEKETKEQTLDKIEEKLRLRGDFMIINANDWKKLRHKKR